RAGAVFVDVAEVDQLVERRDGDAAGHGLGRGAALGAVAERPDRRMTGAERADEGKAARAWLDAAVLGQPHHGGRCDDDDQGGQRAATSVPRRTATAHRPPTGSWVTRSS